PAAKPAAEAKVAPLFGDSSAKGKADSADAGDPAPPGESAQPAHALANGEPVAESSGDDPAQSIPADHAAHAASHDADFSVSAPAVLGDAPPTTPPGAHAPAASPA